MVNPKDIKKHPNFEALFNIKPDVLARIEGAMKETGKYDFSQPVILAQWAGQKEPVCIDGHTRIQAAINAGIESVPVFTHEELESEEEAKLIAIKLQCNRRNLSDGELMTFLELLDAPKEQKRDDKTGRFTTAQDCTTGKSSAAIAETLHISTRKAEELLTVKRHGEPEIKQAVKEGRITGHKAYQDTQKKRSAKNVLAKDSEPAAGAEVFEPKKGSAESSGEKSKNHSAGEMTVTIKPDQYRALRDLGDTIEYHVELAIDVYLRMVADEVEEDENEERTTITPEES